MNPMPELTPMLKQLRLSGVLDSIEARNRQAIEEKFSYMDFLAIIIQDEIARRSQKRLALAIRRPTSATRRLWRSSISPSTPGSTGRSLPIWPPAASSRRSSPL